MEMAPGVMVTQIQIQTEATAILMVKAGQSAEMFIIIIVTHILTLLELLLNRYKGKEMTRKNQLKMYIKTKTFKRP